MKAEQRHLQLRILVNYTAGDLMKKEKLVLVLMEMIQEKITMYQNQPK